MIINWAPTTQEEILQNVGTLLETETGSVPCARAMGTPQEMVDAPQTIAGALVQGEIIAALRTYEPRAAVKSVRMSATPDGLFKATLAVGDP